MTGATATSEGDGDEALASVPGAFEAAEIDPAEFVTLDPDRDGGGGAGNGGGGTGGLGGAGGGGGSGSGGGSDGGGSGGRGGGGQPTFDSGLGGSFDLAGGFEPTVGEASDLAVEGSTTASEGNNIVRLQESVTDGLNKQLNNLANAFDPRTFGPRANTVYEGLALSQTLADNERLLAVAGEGEGGLAYFQGTSVFGLREVDFFVGEQGGVFLFDKVYSYQENGVFVDASGVPTSDGVFTTDSITYSGFDTDGFGPLNSGTGLGPVSVPPGEDPGIGIGAFTAGLTFGGITADLSGGREADNFLFLSLIPAIAYEFTGKRYVAALDDAGCTGAECPGPKEFYIGVVEGDVRRLYNAADIPLGQDADLSGLYEIDSVSADDEPDRNVTQGDVVALLRDPTERRRILFAAGDLDGLVGAAPPGAVVDRFYLSAGMAGEILGGVDGDLAPGMDAGSGAGRAFLRDETWVGLDRRPEGERFELAPSDVVDAGLFVINPTGAVLPTYGPSGELVEPGRTAKVLHADFALRGEGAAQVSTISATIGEVAFRFSALPGQAGPPDEADAFLSARTVGSSRGLTEEGETEASTLVSGGVLSTAAGGGNPNLPGAGRLGFLVLENAGEVFVDGGNEGFVDGRIEAVFAGEAEPGVLPEGRERPVGEDPEAPDLRFAAARLGVATEGSGQRLTASSAFPRLEFKNGPLLGYAAALVEVEGTVDGEAVVGLERLSAPEDGPNLRFSGLDLGRNEIGATLRVGGVEIALGGGEGRSAFLSDELFGLRTAAPEDEGAPDLAMVSGGLVREGLEAAGLRAPREYEHVNGASSWATSGPRPGAGGGTRIWAASWPASGCRRRTACRSPTPWSPIAATRRAACATARTSAPRSAPTATPSTSARARGASGWTSTAAGSPGRRDRRRTSSATTAPCPRRAGSRARCRAASRAPSWARATSARPPASSAPSASRTTAPTPPTHTAPQEPSPQNGFYGVCGCKGPSRLEQPLVPAHGRLEPRTDGGCVAVSRIDQHVALHPRHHRRDEQHRRARRLDPGRAEPAGGRAPAFVPPRDRVLRHDLIARARGDRDRHGVLARRQLAQAHELLQQRGGEVLGGVDHRLPRRRPPPAGAPRTLGAVDRVRAGGVADPVGRQGLGQDAVPRHS